MSAADLLIPSDVNFISRLNDVERRLAEVERRAAGIPAIGVSTLALIQDEKKTAAGANFDFTSIPQIYKHLLLIANLRGDTAATNTNNLIRFNNVSSANYYVQNETGSAATAAAAEALAQTSGIASGSPANTATANLFGKLLAIIPDYIEATNMPGLSFLNFRPIGTATTNLLIASGGFFLNVAGAINRITLTPAAGNWNTGSRLTLYGLG